MSTDEIIPKRARFESGNLIFEGGVGLADALADGCFLLRTPADLDLSPGRTLARNFHREHSGGPDDEYRGYRDRREIYFGREHFQTEHLLLDRVQRQLHLPSPVGALCDRLCELGRGVLQAVLECLDVPRATWERVTVGCLDGRAVEWMAISHYRSERRQLGCPPHKDTGFVTVLYFDQEGLEAWRDGRWKRIDPVPGHLLVNFGGALELLTRRLPRPVEALLHRVAECRPSPEREERISFAAFVNPPASGHLWDIDADGRARPVQSVEEFLRAFNEETWRDSYADFGIAQERAGAGPVAEGAR